jgi:hypothetical protein
MKVYRILLYFGYSLEPVVEIWQFRTKILQKLANYGHFFSRSSCSSGWGGGHKQLQNTRTRG